MQILEQYEFEPLRGCISRKVKDPKGLSKWIIETSFHLGKLTLESFKVLMAMRERNEVNLPEDKVENTINRLVKARIIRKKQI